MKSAAKGCLGLWLICSCLLGVPARAQSSDATSAIAATFGVVPNLESNVSRPLRYRPENGDFVIANGREFFNRPLYGGHTAFRVNAGDRPEFVLYLPGRGGNLRLALSRAGSAKWLHEASRIITRYRPGEMIYEIADDSFGPGARITLEVLAYAEAEGLAVRVTATGVAPGSELVWAYGGVNGQRGRRDGDIGTEPVPIGEYFQFSPEFAADNKIALRAEGFILSSAHATIAGVVPEGSQQQVRDAALWNNLPSLLSGEAKSGAAKIAIGRVRLVSGQPLLLSLQRIDRRRSTSADLQVYREAASSGSAPALQKHVPLPPPFSRASLPAHFAAAEEHFATLRAQVRVDTPDPFLNAAAGALNVAADALWDDDAQKMMHGAIAWRAAFLGWRGPYVLDELGWHDRARANFNSWLPHQNTDVIPAKVPPQDAKFNLARNETALHSNGDLSHSHYDMNMVFVDELFRHLLWTGDAACARESWPAIKRHLAWEKRLFRREYGADKLPLYEAYASIWASDDLYYNGGGTAYASAYNVYANRMAARIAALAGEDPAPYLHEADLILKAMRTLLWMPDQETFAEYKDILGEQHVHPDYALWSFYHTVDEGAVDPRGAWEMAAALQNHFRAIPVKGPGVPDDRPYHVFSETDWMPYSWSINNVVMDEHLHTALALWQSGHSEEAYTLARGSLLASMYMGITPGNVGTLDLLDVYRRESQTDFGDGAGTLSRAIVEGLFGIRPDALAGTLLVSPGFPAEWKYARIDHPDVNLAFERHGRSDVWEIRQSGNRFKKLTLRVPAAFDHVQDVEVNGAKAAWRSDPEAVGKPVLVVDSPAGAETRVRITWAGEPVNEAWQTAAERGETQGDFTRLKHGAFAWWALTRPVAMVKPSPLQSVDWQQDLAHEHFESVELSGAFNDQVTSVFKAGKYLSPRYPGASLELPWQGIGAWAGHLSLLPVIDDSGLRKVSAENGDRLIMPNGIPFATPSAPGARNVVFTSQWDNYPKAWTAPLTGRATHLYLLMAGSTNFMQSGMDNGEVVVTYTDGSSERLALRNPQTWWPIEQDYFIDDYQFPLSAPLPPRVDLKTGNVRLLDARTFKGQGHEIAGGAATVLALKLNPARELRSLTVHAMANDVVIGLLSATLQRP